MPNRPGEWIRAQFDKFSQRKRRWVQSNQAEVQAVNSPTMVESDSSIVTQTPQPESSPTDLVLALTHALEPTSEDAFTIIHEAGVKIRKILSLDTLQELGQALSRIDAGEIDSLVDVMRVQARPLEASERFTSVLSPFNIYQREREGKSASGYNKPFDYSTRTELTPEEYSIRALQGLLQVRDLVKTGVFNNGHLTIDSRQNGVAIRQDGEMVQWLPGLVSPVVNMLYVFVSGENHQRYPLASQQQAEEVLDTVVLPTFLQLATNAGVRLL